MRDGVNIQSLSNSHRLPPGLVQVRLGQKDEIGEFVGGCVGVIGWRTF